ncbi:MAG: hypothetical protein HY520_01335 [Candidatus Aenigmarchaeota archaeon]|nr:hypothetical protein [Candidatus Aenigmarchaeota archaeon]
MQDQHFLESEWCAKVAAAVQTQPGDVILEIGAGRGELTQFLLPLGRVIAIESDPSLFAELRDLAGRRGADVRLGNALHFLRRIRFSIIAANLPYAICEPLFRSLAFHHWREGVATIPRRFAALLGKPPYSFLYQVEELFPVPRDAFSPQPRTDSVVVRVRPRPSLLREVFLLRERRLKNALERALRGKTKREVRASLRGLPAALQDQQVSQLTPADWIAVEEWLGAPKKPADSGHLLSKQQSGENV